MQPADLAAPLRYDCALAGRRVPLAAVIDALSSWACPRIYLCGNGGSAAIASHLAIDLLKRGHRAHPLMDPAAVTAMANDEGWAQGYAGQLRRLARPGEALWAVSSSGQSLNIVAALQAARTGGLYTFTMTGFDPESPARVGADANVYVPSGDYGLVEVTHLAVGHVIAEAL